MTEPIMSREEVGTIWTEISGRPFVEGSLADSFSKRIESAVLAKACGEPVAWMSWKDGDGYGFWDTKDEAEQASAYDFEPEPLYALNRSKS